MNKLLKTALTLVATGGFAIPGPVTAESEQVRGDIVVERHKALLDLLTTVKIDEAERFDCIGDPLHEDWKVVAGNAKNVGNDAGGDLRGDLIDKIDRSKADPRLDKLGRQRRRFGPHSVH